MIKNDKIQDKYIFTWDEAATFWQDEFGGSRSSVYRRLAPARLGHNMYDAQMIERLYAVEEDRRSNTISIADFRAYCQEHQISWSTARTRAARSLFRVPGRKTRYWHGIIAFLEASS